MKGFCVPICAQTISVKAPMNWGVALRLRFRDSSSTIWPMAYQRADLRRWGVFCSELCSIHSCERGSN